MKRFPVILVVLGFALVPAGASTAAPVPAYTVLDLGTLGGATSDANAVSDSGFVVGSAKTPRGARHAFRWSNDSMTEIETLGGKNSDALDVNDDGTVVGWAETGASCNDRAVTHAYVYRRDGLHAIGPYEFSYCAMSSGATGINDSGQIVGWKHTPSFDIVPFSYRRGDFRVLNDAPGHEPMVTDVNESGEIVGYDFYSQLLFVEAGTPPRLSFSFAFPGAFRDLAANAIDNSGRIVGKFSQAFLYSGGPAGTVQLLGTLGGDTSEAFGIDDNGDIVGSSKTKGGATHAFLWSEGVLRDLNDVLPADSGWRLQVARDINNSGWIVGSGVHDGARHAFLLRPS